jgi:hypothetical protein
MFTVNQDDYPGAAVYASEDFDGFNYFIGRLLYRRQINHKQGSIRKRAGVADDNFFDISVLNFGDGEIKLVANGIQQIRSFF